MNDCRINPSDSESLSLDFIDALLEGGEKQCPKCGKIKPAGEFYKRIHRTGGRSIWCKECIRNSMRAASKRYYRCVKTPLCPRAGVLGAELVVFTCEVCGKEFRRLKSEVDYNYASRGILPRFCSRECRIASTRKDYISPYARKIERIKKEGGS
jgi:ssDNA-binding Zn-finger/Zn-ribbon topoisomerase 1